MKKTMITAIALLFCITGCQLRRTIDVEVSQGQEENNISTEETVLTGLIWDLDYSDEVLEQFSQRAQSDVVDMIYGEEAEQYQLKKMENHWQSNLYFYHYTQNFIEVECVEHGRMGSIYASVDNETGEISEYQLREVAPLEELDNCSREEAIAFCAPYAEAFGWNGSDIQIETYAITLDTLEKVAYWGPPDENRIIYTDKQILEMAKNEEEQIQMLFDRMRLGGSELPWEKKHEAIVLIYKDYIEGIRLEGHAESKKMIYIPYLNRIVFAQGNLPFSNITIRSEQEIISKEEAIEVALLEVGVKTFDNVEYVYMLWDEDDMDGLLSKIAIPAWRVDYTRNGKHDSIWVNAIDGSLRESF